MHFSVFYQCFTTVVLLDLGACFTANEKQSVPSTAKRDLAGYQPDDTPEEEDGNEWDTGSRFDELTMHSSGAPQKREVPAEDDLSSIRRRFSLGKDLQSIAQENYMRELAHGDAVDKEDLARKRRKSVSAVQEEDRGSYKKTASAEEKPFLNYYYPSIGNKIRPGVGWARRKRHGETDYPGYDMKVHVQKREASLDNAPSGEASLDDSPSGEASLDDSPSGEALLDDAPSGAEKGEASLDDALGDEALLDDAPEREEPAFPVKKVVQPPIAIDADSVYIDGLRRRRKRRRTEEKREEEDDTAEDDEEGAANFIHYQIEKLKQKVKRDFEQSRRRRRGESSEQEEEKREVAKSSEERKRGDKKRNVAKSSSDGKREAKKLEVAMSSEEENRAKKRKVVTSSEEGKCEVAKSSEEGKRGKKKRTVAKSASEGKLEVAKSTSDGKREANERTVAKLKQNAKEGTSELVTASPTSRDRRQLEAVGMDLAQHETVSSKFRARSKREVADNSRTFDMARFEHQARLGLIEVRSLKKGPDKFDEEKSKSDEASQADTKLHDTSKVLTDASLAHDESNMSESDASPSLGRAKKKKRNLDALFVDRSFFENDEFAPVEHVVGNTKRKRRDVGELSDENSLEENKSSTQVKKRFTTRLEGLGARNGGGVEDRFNENIHINEAEVTKMKQDLDDLFKTINLSKAKNIIPEINRHEIINTPKGKMPYQNENGRDNNQETEVAENSNERLRGATRHGGGAASSSSSDESGVATSSKVKGDTSREDSLEEDVDNLERSAEAIVKDSKSSTYQHRHMRAPRRRRLLSLAATAAADNNNNNREDGAEKTKRDSAARFDNQIESNVRDGLLQEDKMVSSLYKRDVEKSSRTILDSDDGRLKVSDVSGSEETSRHSRSYEGDDKNISPSSQQGAGEEGKQDVLLNLKTQDSDPGSAKRLKAVNEELDEHNQRAIQLRNMDVKVGPQVAEVAKLIEQSRQKDDNNKDRTQVSGEGILASLACMENDRGGSNDNMSSTLKEERAKRSTHHHHHSNDTRPSELGDDDDLAADLSRYLMGSGNEYHKLMYKPVVDWQAGDRERFEELKAHRKLNGFSPNDDDQIISSNNMDDSGVREVEENNRDKVSVAESRRNYKFDRGGQKKCIASDDLTSCDADEDPSSLMDNIDHKQTHDRALKTSARDLAQRRKLFELLKISNDQYNGNNVDASDDSRSSWLKHLFKNRESDEELVNKVNKMEAESLKEKSLPVYNNNAGVHADEARKLEGYVIRKRDLGDVGDQRARVYYERPYAAKSFHNRMVPRYGQPTPDMFHKWNNPQDVHSFSKNLFKDLETPPTDTITAGFDNEGNYVSPIALDRVRRLRQEKRRRRRRGVREELRERRRKRANFLFPKADPVDEFFANRPLREREDEYEGEVRQKRDARTDDKGWPVSNGAETSSEHHVVIVALALFNLAHHAA